MFRMIESSTLPTNSKINDSFSKECEINEPKLTRLDKAIIRFSSWKILIQCILMSPSFIAPFYVGVHYLGECPIQPLINTYLIIHACLNLANILFLLISFITAKFITKSMDNSNCLQDLFISSLIGQLVVFLLSFAWLIVGQVWIFESQSNGFQSTDPTQTATYCRSAIFWNAFASIIITYAIWLLIILIILGRIIIKRCKAKQKIACKYDEC